MRSRNKKNKTVWPCSCPEWHPQKSLKIKVLRLLIGTMISHVQHCATVFKFPRVFKIASAISGSFLLLNYLNEVRLPLVTCLGCSMLFINKAVQATMKPHHTHLFGEILDLLKGLPSGERVHMPRLFQTNISLRGLCSFPEKCSFRCFF